MRNTQTSWTCDAPDCDSIVTKMGHEPQTDPPRKWCKIWIAAVNAEGVGQDISVYACHQSGHLGAALAKAAEHATSMRDY